MDYDAIAQQFGGKTVEDRGKKIANAQMDFEKYQKEADVPLGRRFLSALPKATFDVGLKAPLKFGASAALAPVDIARGVMGKQPIQAPTFQAGAQQRFNKLYDKAEQGNLGKFEQLQGLAPFAEVPLAAAEAVGLGKGLSKTATAAKSIFAGRAERKAIEKALEIVKPTLSAKEQVKAFGQNRGRFQGLSRKVTVGATSKDVDVAEAAAPFVKKGNHFDNIQRLSEEVGRSSDELREGLRSSNAIWNRNELKSVLNKVEKPITVKSDKTLSNQAEYLKQAALDLAEKANKKTEGILDLRQQLDDLINQEFPNIYDKDLTPMRLYVRQFRQALNDFGASKMPNGMLPNGKSVKDTWRYQHLLITAKDNIAEKAPSIGSTVAKRFGEKYPTLKKVGGVAAGIGISSAVGAGVYGALGR